MRRSTLGALRWMRMRGLTREECAARLGLAASTVALWEREWRERRLRAELRGRRPKHATKIERRELFELLASEGAGVGVPTLELRFPSLARRELEELCARTSYSLRRRRRWTLHELRWKRPGAVWAADFSQPPCWIDGEYERLMLVRDLGSQRQLEASPAHFESAAEVCVVLEALFLEHGAPLVLKVDNGSGFISEAARELCARYGVLILYSPPKRPSYNGACEAGNGSIKRRAQRIAAHRGRAGCWSADDVEHARLQANACTRPWGRTGPSPDQVWRGRTPLLPEERAAFGLTYARELLAELEARRPPEPPPQPRRARYARPRGHPPRLAST